MHESLRLAGLLAALQETRSCQGFEETAQRSKLHPYRTLYRWREEFGGRLRFIPSFTGEALGLCHLHLFIADPAAAWLRFPYAVEHAWLSPDYVYNQLYLHCLVPREHKAAVRQFLQERPAGCAGLTMVWTDDGWQEVPGITREDITFFPADASVGFLREHPLVVPVLFEAWREESMKGIWSRVQERLGPDVRAWVRLGRVYSTNGTRLVRRAYEALNREALFRQYLTRYAGWSEEPIDIVILLRQTGEWLPEFVEALRPFAKVIETYADDDGTSVLHVAGTAEIRRLLHCAQHDLRRYQARIFGHNPFYPPTEVGGFRYDFLFDPKNGSWQFPIETITRHMRGDE